MSLEKLKKYISDYKEKNEGILKKYNIDIVISSLTFKNKTFNGIVFTPIPIRFSTVPHSYNPKYNPPPIIITDILGIISAESIAKFYGLNFTTETVKFPPEKHCPGFTSYFSKKEEIDPIVKNNLRKKKDFEYLYEELNKKRKETIEEALKKLKK